MIQDALLSRVITSVITSVIIVASTITFSMPALAEITVSETVVVMPKVALPKVAIPKVAMPSEALSAPTLSNCIADSAITAKALSDTADNGPFTVATKRVSRQSAHGFGGGTIYYPTNASGCGLLGGIAVVPGYVSYESAIKWWGPRLASWGFVVITINTNDTSDNPDSRATQLSAALDHLLLDSAVGHVVDRERLGVIGWSMGGGGALKLATDRSTVRAIIAQTPYYDTSYPTMDTPALFIACEKDRVAPNKKYTNVFYNNAAGPKMKVEVNNGSHFCASYGFHKRLLSKPGIAWMQRYINGDTRFDQFLCSSENYKSSPEISSYNYENCL